MRADLDNLPRGQQQQRGAGGYTLCHRCNNETGSWYGTAFADWTHQAMRILYATRGRASLFYTFHILPLRVLKQLACMFFSANGPDFCEAHPELVRFVKNRWLMGLREKYRFYAYYMDSGSTLGRSIGVAGALDIYNRQFRVLSEISFPPLGYVLSLSGSPPDNRLVDISWFGRFLYDDYRHIDLRLPVLPVATPFPGDYRDDATVRADRDRNREQYGI